MAPLDDVVNEPEKQAPFLDTQKTLVPDPVDFSAWFDQAHPAKRMQSVGARRYLHLKARLGYEPTYADLLDPETGTLIAHDKLHAETPGTHQARRKDALALLRERKKQLRQALTFGFLWPES